MAKREPSGEDKLIERFFKPLASHPGALALSDDAAFLTPPAGHDLVLTADMTVAGVHFFPDDPPETIGKKALRVNLSDLAAKGAEPVGALMTISLPGRTDEFWIEQFARGLGEDCAAFGCPLLGGDTTKTPGPLTISITAIGKVPTGAMVRRAGAKPGDLITISGTIGDGALGLFASRNDPSLSGLSGEQRDELIRRYRVPEPRLALAPLLREYATAAMDVSDGLVGDLAKLAANSDVAASVEVSKLPLSNPAHDAIEAMPALLERVLTGGDDYEVLAAIPDARFPAFAEAAGRVGVPVTAIGRFSSGEGIRVIGLRGEELSFAKSAYSHF
ncbi:MAG TPA: thiamine-phosphate kinase [Xanthobacteraceae bacterium]|nr:thiamine-phosphate kinase [Xanthobacteraceae bacterium]